MIIVFGARPAAEPYPNRWTHHVLLSRRDQVDGELLAWLRETYEFASQKQSD